MAAGVPQMSDPHRPEPPAPEHRSEPPAPEHRSEPPMPERRPALRASDADRERVVDLLRQAAGDGRLDVEELDERTSAAYTTRTLAGLETLTQDLVPASAAAPAASGGVVVRTGGPDRGTRWIVSIMSGHDRKGRWRVAPTCLVLSIMGGAELDFNDAELSDPVTRIRVISIMGGTEIRMPRGVDVKVSKFALMGGHDVELDPDPPPPGAPVIHISMFALMGGGEVRQGRRRRKNVRHD
jgi:hypothetical protein